jgi:Fic family protein
MRSFDYVALSQRLSTGDAAGLSAQLRAYKAKEAEWTAAKTDALNALLTDAKIQSVGASNRIEGIFTTDERLTLLIGNKVEPQTRGEEEIAGYREVLNLIHQSYNDIPLTDGVICQLHRDMFQYSEVSGGKYKMADNYIAQTGADGREFVRFKPLSAFETPQAMKDICDAANAALSSPDCEPLVVIPCFILDFLCIHPFDDGNGRISRLLTLLLLYKAGYNAGKYISIEKLIENTKETYYEALALGSHDWQSGGNDYAPFTRYSLGILLGAYRKWELKLSTRI